MQDELQCFHIIIPPLQNIQLLQKSILTPSLSTVFFELTDYEIDRSTLDFFPWICPDMLYELWDFIFTGVRLQFAAGGSNKVVDPSHR